MLPADVVSPPPLPCTPPPFVDSSLDASGPALGCSRIVLQRSGSKTCAEILSFRVCSVEHTYWTLTNTILNQHYVQRHIHCIRCVKVIFHTIYSLYMVCKGHISVLIKYGVCQCSVSMFYRATEIYSLYMVCKGYISWIVYGVWRFFGERSYMVDQGFMSCIIYGVVCASCILWLADTRRCRGY